MRQATAAAARAYKTWKEVGVQHRQRVMLKLQHLIREHTEELALAITTEQGKTLADARGDVYRGLEVVEYTCGAATLMMGETVANLATSLDTYSFKEPLGVCAGICPFNFPAMIPLWMFPTGTVTGNTYILKPSEKAPGAAMILARLAQEAGLPNGVLNILHGAHETVNYICDAPEIRAISFVGSNQVGESIYARASATGKRVQANLGAKNHAVILPDCNPHHAIQAIAGAAFGAAGQRCMALSVVLFIGSSKAWIHDLVKIGQSMTVNGGMEPHTDVGPLITQAAKDRANALIQASCDHGASILLDGRHVVVPKYPHGHFLGPTVLDHVTTDNPAYMNELFAPIVVCMTLDTLDEAIALINRNPYGNGTSLFTSSGAKARWFQHAINVGQVGINVPIPVPLPMFSFTSSKASIRGDCHFYGKSGINFYTQPKTITSLWDLQEATPYNTIMPML